MQQHTHAYLRFVRFKDLNQWDVKRFWDDINVLFSSSVRLKDILSPHYEPVSKEEMLNKQWRIISKINFSGKLFLRDVSDAKTFKGNLNKIDSNTLIYSKINVRHGCIYFHPNNSIPFGVSSEYPAYKLNNQKVNGEFLVMIIQSDYFKNVLNQKTSGISKARVKPEEFLNINIPLPTLEQQQALVKAYNDKIQQAKILEEQAERIDKNIENYLLTELGIKQNNYSSPESPISIASEPQVEYVISNHQNAEMPDAYHWGDEIKKEYKYLKFVRFKEVERWDVSFFTQKNNIVGNYNTISMGKCIDCFMQDQQGNTLRIETSKHPETTYQYIGMENIEKETGELLEEKIVKGSDIKSQTVRVPKSFFLYGKLRPYLNKYWYNESDSENIVCSSEFFVFSIKNNINPYYFKYYLASSAVQQQITNAFRGARMPRINEDTFKSIEIPLPPIDIQNAIVEHINKQKEQIKQLRQQAESLRKEALEDFEKEIFE